MSFFFIFFFILALRITPSELWNLLGRLTFSQRRTDKLWFHSFAISFYGRATAANFSRQSEGKEKTWNKRIRWTCQQWGVKLGGPRVFDKRGFGERTWSERIACLRSIRTEAKIASRLQDQWFGREIVAFNGVAHGSDLSRYFVSLHVEAKLAKYGWHWYCTVKMYISTLVSVGTELQFDARQSPIPDGSGASRAMSFQLTRGRTGKALWSLEISHESRLQRCLHGFPVLYRMVLPMGQNVKR